MEAILTRDQIVDSLGGDAWAIVSAVCGSCESEEEVAMILDSIFQVKVTRQVAASIWYWVRR